eukprot:CAMPEP_0202505812 /NCGR_PEP_ID=MMETSP1361-20130828/48242_1 /ASSEMBLY_ACC=CAM_ASM_000849 /TAXON_ID=210615 /ORGANISM="Staurosira complex sp., Strain CCMP2646" /LENGTH=97 /DNA_ID=CAMNT_0049139635 /DNA_START=151 /DNA_END=442 /DNA_ORIENTATION=-
MEQLRPSLTGMGIPNLDISDAALIQSITCGFNHFDQPGNRIKAMKNLALSTSDRQFEKRQQKQSGLWDKKEMSMFLKKREPMYGWTPPEDSLVPKDW